MTEEPSAKSWKREVGGILLAAAGLVSWRYWTLADVELIKAYGGAYGTLVSVLIVIGTTPFIAHSFKPKK